MGCVPRRVDKKKPYVVYWNNIPAPYMVDRFNALARRGTVDLEVWFSRRSESDRSWEVDERTWRFRYRYLPTARILGRDYCVPVPVVLANPDMLISLYSEPSFIFGWMIAKAKRIKTGLRVLKTFDTWVHRRWWKELFKRLLFRGADAIETPGEDGKAYALRYGAIEQRIFIVNHTVDPEWAKKVLDYDPEERTRLRQETGATGTTFLYVGRLVREKGVDVLLEAYRRLRSHTRKPTSLIVVGDGRDEQIFHRTCSMLNIENVVFAGYKQKSELYRYYRVADVFVFPTLGDPYGLVVDEAMACALPVIATSAAGEICDRVRDGINGFIVPPGNIEILADRMFLFVQDSGLGSKMGRLSLERVSNNTPERWARGFERMVFRVLGE